MGHHADTSGEVSLPTTRRRVSDPTGYGDAQMTPSGGLPRRVPRKVEAFSISRGWPRRTVAVGGVAVVPGGEGVAASSDKFVVRV